MCLKFLIIINGSRVRIWEFVERLLGLCEEKKYEGEEVEEEEAFGFIQRFFFLVVEKICRKVGGVFR